MIVTASSNLLMGFSHLIPYGTVFSFSPAPIPNIDLPLDNSSKVRKVYASTAGFLLKASVTPVPR